MNLRERQRLGAAVIVMIAGAVYFLRAYAPIEYPLWKRFHCNADLRSGSTVVEWDGGGDGRGIYYLPQGSTIGDLLDLTGVAKPYGSGIVDRKCLLRSGMSIRIDERRESGRFVRIGGMTNAVRFALDLPVGLNTATQRDLMLVPGIGEKTAEAILQRRREVGTFRVLDDLLNVKGIGNKKLETFQRHFYIDAGR